MRHADSHLARAVRLWACALALLLALGCNPIFDISEGTPRPLCADPLLIDDLEDGDGTICPTNGREGGWWVSGDGTTDAESNPRQGQPFEPTLIAEGPRGNSRYAARFRGSGFTGWGALMGLNLTSLTYDVRGLDGIRFWMRSATPVSIALSTSETVPIRFGGECDESSTEHACNSHFEFAITAPSRDWFEYRVPFNALRQAEGSTNWNPRHLVNIQVNVPPGAAFDVSIDDLRFFTCGGTDCLPTCTDPEFPISCGEGEGSLASCQPAETDCDEVTEGLGGPAMVARGGGDPECVGLPSEQLPRCFLEAPTGIPFATRVNPYTDGVSNARLRNPEPGKVCMQGTLAGGGAAAISPIVSPIVTDFPPVVSHPFDLQALNLKEIEFTIEKAPSGGVSLELRSLTQDACAPGYYCIGTVFTLGRPNPRVFQNGTARVELADFGSTGSAPAHILSFYFWGHSSSRFPTNYDFCLSDVKFFSWGGEVVTPPPAGGG